MRAAGECAHGQLSLYVKRWCNTTSVSYTNAGIDDNAYQASNFRLGAVADTRACSSDEASASGLMGPFFPFVRAPRGILLQGGQRGEHDLRPERAVLGCDVRLRAQLLRQRPHLLAYAHACAAWNRWSLHILTRPAVRAPRGEGRIGAGATCSGNTAPGYYFDPVAVTLAGANATTSTCAPGLIGFATRLCLWNGPNSAAGVWADAISHCLRTAAARVWLPARAHDVAR